MLKFEDIYIFTNNVREYEQFKPLCKKINIFSTIEEYLEQANLILNNDKYIKDVSRNCVVFDDFNETIKPDHPDYKKMFTQGRHKGVRIINLAHSSKAVSPTVRSQTNYLFMASCIQREEAQKLNKLFINISQNDLVSKILEMQDNTRNYLVFNTQKRQFL